MAILFFNFIYLKLLYRDFIGHDSGLLLQYATYNELIQVQARDPFSFSPPILLTIRISDKSILYTISYIQPLFSFGKITYNSYSF